MRTFEVPAAYARYVESQIITLLAEIGRDRGWRDEDDPRVQAFCKAEISERLDPTAVGVVRIVVGVEDGEVLPVPKRGERLARVLKVMP